MKGTLLLAALQFFSASLLSAEQVPQKLSHWDQAERRVALEAIKLHPEKYTQQPLLMKVTSLTTEDKNCGVRTLAAEALGSLAPYTDISLATSSLKRALHDTIDTVRRAALETLCAPQSPARLTSDELDPLLEDSSRSVRRVAKGCVP